MGKFGDIQYLVDRPEPSEIFLKARNISGKQLQKQFNQINEKPINSSYEGFKWIKAELTYPSFDNLTFAYKNSIFSVVIELINESETSFSIQQKNRLIDACNSNNLVPCLFKININEIKPSYFSNLLKKGVEKEDVELSPLENGWNLFNPITNERINPERIAKETPIKMSIWELHNFAIQIVRSDIEKDGNKILSFCDVPEINPQIWFKDKNGIINWVVVRYITDKNDLDYREWLGLENKNNQLLPHDGFLATIQFFSINNNSHEIINRGDAISVKYKGLERIYVS